MDGEYRELTGTDNGVPSRPLARRLATLSTRLGRRVWRWTLDLLLPSQCLGCKARVDHPGGLCPDCWSRLRFIGPPLCVRCGLPFDYTLPTETQCAECHRHPPLFNRARSALAYDDASRPLLLGFKHADKTFVAPALGRWLHRAGIDLIAETDVIVPVPLHWVRLWRRRYNQAALLAQALGGQCRVPVAVGLLRRQRPTRVQGGLSRAARHRNVRGAIHIRPDQGARLHGQSVLLIDDVMTTGATLTECTRVLRKAGAAKVNVLTVARVLRPVT